TPSVEVGPLRVPAILAAMSAIWIVTQSLPFQSAAGLSPLWDEAARAMGSAVHPSISLDRDETIGHLVRLLTYAATFLAAWRIGRKSDDAGLIVRAIGVIGSIYALYGLIAYFSGTRTVLWFAKWAYQDDLTGTFINRSTFATFIGLCLLANL